MKKHLLTTLLLLATFASVSADTYLTIRGDVYEKPDVGSRVLTTIYTDEPIVTGNPFTEEWIAVNLPGKGGKGYMKRDFLIRLATAEQIEESGAELMRIGIPPRPGCILHKKNRSNSKELSRLRGGIVLRVLSSDEETGMVKIKYDKSKTGYMKATDLPLYYVHPDDREFAEKWTPEFWTQYAIPKEGAYRVVNSYLCQFKGTEPAYYGQSNILPDVRRENNKFYSVPLKDGKRGAVKVHGLEKMNLYDLMMEFGPSSQIVQDELKAIERSGHGKIVRDDGFRAGEFAVYPIMVISLILMIFTLVRRFIRRAGGAWHLRGAALSVYALLLLVVSLLEIWYFLSLDVGETAWFLTQDNWDYRIANTLLLFLVAGHQLCALKIAMNDYSETSYFEVDTKWMLRGVVISAALYAAARYFGIMTSHHALLITFCVVLGQLPQFFLIGKRGYYAYRMQSSFGNWSLAVYYLLSMTGTVLIALLMTIVALIILVAWFAMYALTGFGSRPDTPSDRDRELQRLRNELEDLESSVNRDSIDPITAESRLGRIRDDIDCARKK